MTNETDKQDLIPDEMWVRPTAFGNYCMTDNKAYRCDEDVKYIRADALDFKIVDAEPAPLPEDRQMASEWFEEVIEHNISWENEKPNHDKCIETIRAALTRPVPSEVVEALATLRDASFCDGYKAGFSSGARQDGIEKRCFDKPSPSAQRKALAALQAPVEGVDKWQPIETAPSNVKVLLYCPDRGCVTNKARIELDYAKYGKRIDNVSSSMSFHSWATHWMPLPQPPEQEE